MPALRGSSNGEYKIIFISLLINIRWIKIVSVYGIYIRDFIQSIYFLSIHVSEYVIYYPCFRVCYLLTMFQSMFSIYPCFRVCFILSKFQSMFSIIQVSEYVFYYPSFRICFLLSKFQSMFSIINVSKYVFYYQRFSFTQSMFSIIHVSEYVIKCRPNKSLLIICWS